MVVLTTGCWSWQCLHLKAHVITLYILHYICQKRRQLALPISTEAAQLSSLASVGRPMLQQL